MSLRTMTAITNFQRGSSSHLVIDSDISKNIASWSYTYERRWQSLPLVCDTQKGPLSDDKGVTDHVQLTEMLMNKL